MADKNFIFLVMSEITVADFFALTCWLLSKSFKGRMWSLVLIYPVLQINHLLYSLNSSYFSTLEISIKKFCIQATLNFSPDADSITIAKRRKKTEWRSIIFLEVVKK